MIANFIFRALQIECPTYLDIGANEPKKFSNTYFFYLKGCRGVLVEPDPSLHVSLVRERPKDTCLQVGVASVEEAARPFFVMSTPTLNTFSEEEAQRYEATGMHRIVRTEQLPVVSIHRILKEHFGDSAPDFLTVDVEGLDFEIMASIDFEKYRPIVVCIETLTFTEDKSESKVATIADLLKAAGYMVYADTYINTIFVDQKRWQARA